MVCVRVCMSVNVLVGSDWKPFTASQTRVQTPGSTGKKGNVSFSEDCGIENVDMGVLTSLTTRMCLFSWLE